MIVKIRTLLNSIAKIYDRLFFRFCLLKGGEDLCKFYRKKGVEIGKGCRISTRYLTLSEPHLIKIGDHVTLSTNCCLITHDGGYRVFGEKYRTYGRPGPIVIGNNCFIGAFSIILPGVSVGSCSIVAAGAVVSKNVPKNSVVAGVPAVVIKSIDEYEKSLIKDKRFKDWGIDSCLRTEQTKFFFGNMENDKQ